MAWGKVDLCGLDTSKLPVLTPQRMQELYPLVHSGDKAARDEFIQGNLRLVLSVIQRFSGRGENVDDLFQVGCIGLMKALDNFDVSQNVRFSTYAVPMVIGEIRRYLRDNNAIRVSRSMRDTAYKALRARDRLQTELSREPTVEEIAAVELHARLVGIHVHRDAADGIDHGRDFLHAACFVLEHEVVIVSAQNINLLRIGFDVAPDGLCLGEV